MFCFVFNEYVVSTFLSFFQENMASFLLLFGARLLSERLGALGPPVALYACASPSSAFFVVLGREDKGMT